MVKSRSSVPNNDTDPRNMPPGTRCYIYLRHSPGDNQTLDSQEAEIRRLCTAKGWIVIRIFRDRGISGKSVENRDGFEQMIYLAKRPSREADMIIIWDYSRFARNMDHAQLHRAEFRSHGLQIHSMKDEVPSGPMSKLYEVLIDWKNEQFLIDLRANTKRGLTYVAERGCVPTGQIAKGYSYRQEQIGAYKDGRIRYGRKPEIDPHCQPLITHAFEMKAQGAPHDAIAEATGLYGPKSGSWNSLFQNRAYIGEYESLGQVFTTIYPPMIEPALFDEVQARIPKVDTQTLSGKNHPRRKASTFILADIGVCSYCDAAMEGKRVGKYRYYVCSRHNERVENCPQSELIPADVLEENVISLLQTHVLTESYLTQLLAWTNERLNDGLEQLRLRLQSTQRELIGAEHDLEKYTRNFGMMEKPTIMAERLLHEKDDQVAQLHGEVAEFQHELDNSRIEIDSDTMARYLSDARNLIDQAESFDLRELCNRLFTRIVMSHDECLIELHFPEC